jgi:predicted RNase H-like HicB family nuclease
MSDALHYSMVIEWSDEDDAYVASLPEWGDLVHTHGDSYKEVLRNGCELVEGLVAVRQARGETLPEPRVFAAVS